MKHLSIGLGQLRGPIHDQTSELGQPCWPNATRHEGLFCSPSLLSAGDRITVGQKEKERLQT